MSPMIDVQTPGHWRAGSLDRWREGRGAEHTTPRICDGRSSDHSVSIPILRRNESETPRNSMHHNAQNTPNRPAKVSDLKPKGGKGSADKGR